MNGDIEFLDVFEKEFLDKIVAKIEGVQRDDQGDGLTLDPLLLYVMKIFEQLTKYLLCMIYSKGLVYYSITIVGLNSDKNQV